jgi:tetratricopeptide (TPR) repeat protein/transcriptional regulator with XRE-family HTH domain
VGIELSGPDPERVFTIVDLARELGLLRARAAGGTYKARISLAELAARVGEPRSTVHAYVTGRHLPPAAVLDRIVIALGASPREQRQWSEAWFRVTGSRHGKQPKPVAWTSPPPRQLPPDITAFCGRHLELHRLDALQSGHTPVAIAALTGGGGVGKTALALHWAHRIADQYPDGQLWCDLRGYDPGLPLDPGAVLAGFLVALGAPRAELPEGTDDRSALYRTLLSDRRVMVVLDNVGEAEQIRPLLPGSASCLVIATSRDRLSGLVARDGAHRIDLDVLPLPDALELLRGLLGSQVDDDPEAAREVVKRCAALPLALRITAEWASARPSTALRDLASELADEQRLLDVLDAGGDQRTAIRAVFSWSTRRLAPKSYAALRWLALHPGRSFDALIVSALLGGDLHQARNAVAELSAAHLIEHAGAGAHSMHDLVRAWAAERCAREEPQANLAAALDRLAAYYLSRATAAMNLLYQHEKHRRPAVADAAPVPAFDDPAKARGFLEAELEAMLGVAARVPAHTVALARILSRHLETTGRFAQAQALHDGALAAARAAGDQAAVPGCLVNLSAAQARAGQYPLAVRHLELAVKLSRDLGAVAELARALDDLGTVHGRTGRFADALHCFTEALALSRELHDTDGEARALHNLGTLHGITGNYKAAESCFEDALSLCRSLGDRLGEAYAVDNLGSVYCHEARYAESVRCHQKALALRREYGDLLGTAHALDHLGTAYRLMGRPREALDCHHESLTLRQDIGDLGDEPHALNNLGATRLLLGEPDQAIRLHHLALAQCRETGNRYEQARAHDGLGAAHEALDDPDQAREHWLDALAIYGELGVPEAAGVTARLAVRDQAEFQG